MISHRLRFALAALVAALPMLLPTGAGARTFVVPLVIEDVAATYTLDTTFKFLYTGGLAGIPAAGGAQVDLYLYDHLGTLMQGLSGALCNPCTFSLTTSSRAVRVRLEDLPGYTGFGPRQQQQGFAIVVVGGFDPAMVIVEAYLTNTQQNAYRVSVMNVPFREVTAP